MQQFIDGLGITMTTGRAISNPNMPDSDDMDHWTCTLSYKVPGQTRTLRIPYSCGLGHQGKAPSAADVLDTLASDATGYEAATGFEGWCAEFGYDTDSRKAERTYRALERQTRRLKQWLDPKVYETLLDAERL